jgi:isopenicillin-N N-acyltransferase-like protein
MCCVEASTTDFSLLYPQDGYLVHTNHYLDPWTTRYEALFAGRGGYSFANVSGSVVRYNRALRLVEKKLWDINAEYLVRILSDHANRPSSICRHEKSGVLPFLQYKTIYATIVDLIRLEMMVCRGNTFEGKFEKYSLK